MMSEKICNPDGFAARQGASLGGRVTFSGPRYF